MTQIKARFEVSNLAARAVPDKKPFTRLPEGLPFDTVPKMSNCKYLVLFYIFSKPQSKLTSTNYT